jgi:hypothetical protein
MRRQLILRKLRPLKHGGITILFPNARATVHIKRTLFVPTSGGGVSSMSLFGQDSGGME